MKWLQDAPPIQILFVLGLVVVGGVMVAGVFVDAEPEREPVAASTEGPEPVESTEPVRPSPEPSPAASPEPSPVVVDPVVVEGGEGNTAPFELPAGRVTVEIVTSGDCYFGFGLRTTDDRSAADLPSVDGEGTASTDLYGLEGGEYFVRSFTGASCSWTATFTPA